MIKLKYISFLCPLFFVLTARAQQSPAFNVQRTYHAAIEFLENDKYVAAAEQFRQVEAFRVQTSTQPKFESELSLIKENAQYYEALCALELGNDDAESMFLRFIKEHPENPLTKLAYFQIGRSYSRQEKYTEALK